MAIYSGFSHKKMVIFRYVILPEGNSQQMSIVKQIILGMKFGTTSEIMIGTHLPLLLLDRLHLSGLIQWIGLRENLQETIDFPIKYGVFL